MYKNEKKFFIFPKISTEFLWIAVTFSASLFALSLIPLIPNDFWWHLKVGEIIFHTKSIPKTNMFAWSLPNNYPYFYGAWLGELLFYLVYKIGQVPLILFVRNVLGGIVLGVLSLLSFRKSKSWRVSAIVLVIFFLMFWYNGSVRTQMWAWILFIVFFFLVDSYSQGSINQYWLVVLPIVMILWTNLHGSFVLGLVIIFIYLISELISKLLLPHKSNSWNHLFWLVIIFAITSLAILVNPHGIGIVKYINHMLTDQPTQSLILEWQPPAPTTLGNITFYISILILLVTLAYSKYRPKLPELLLISAFLWLAWNGQRYIIWYAMIAIPTIAALISQMPFKTLKFEKQKNWLNTLLVIILLTPIVLVQPWFVENFPLPKRYTKMLSPPNDVGPLLTKDTPINASNYLKNHPGGKLFNDIVFASYLIWANEEQPVFIDLRAEMFPNQQWIDYFSISQGNNFDIILSDYGADRILLNRDLQSGLELSLYTSNKWRLEYSDDISQIWVKFNSDKK